jgi:hypothetical protein
MIYRNGSELEILPPTTYTTTGEYMLAQVVLTPAESKKLIAKAVAKLEAVQQAAKKGIVALHPSSSTYFIIEEVRNLRPSRRLENREPLKAVVLLPLAT